MTQAALVAQLSEPGLYPSRPEAVEIIQTHISIVCVAGPDVYKLKKHVAFPFLDFSTLEGRKAACADEVRLNRRLCPDVYREVVPLRLDSGKLAWGVGSGQVIDYAVLMTRLPEAEMLNHRIEQNRVSVAEMRAIARVMVGFHQRAERGADVKRAGAPATLEQFALSNFAELRGAEDLELSEPLLTQLENATQTDFDTHRALLEHRCESGRVVEGHGDLHARNICLTEPVSIFDCLEFSPKLRCGDVATENAFLVMDLLYRGRPDLSDAYLDEYQSLVDDKDLARLIPMLVRYRALVRAKVSALTAAGSGVTAEERAHAQESVRKHLILAAGSLLVEQRPVWILGCGLPGSGKSTFLTQLAASTSLPLVSSDQVRKSQAGVSPVTRLGPGSYTASTSRATYQMTLDAAQRLCRGGSVIVDAGFRTREERQRARDAAEACGGRLVVVWMRPSPEQNRAWLKERESDASSVSDAGLAVYETLESEFEPPHETEDAVIVQVDPTRPSLENLERVLGVALGA